MPFYTFNQNNSGGSFYGPKYVIVRAPNARYANFKATEEADVYFDGCEKGQDCPCCGDRWSEVDEHDAKDSPMIYYEPVQITDLEVREVIPYASNADFNPGKLADGKVLYIP